MSADNYLTLASSAEVSQKVLNSKFIAVAVPVAAKEAATNMLGSLRKKHFDATHVCYAYRLIGAENGDQLSLGFSATGIIEKSSDDGEPSGTAGKPILNALKTKSLCNALVAVIRYYGGTNLGIGGLVRAYGDAALAAVEKAGTIEVFLPDLFSIEFDYGLEGTVRHVLEKFSAGITASRYHDAGQTATVSVRLSLREPLVAALMEATQGRITVLP